MDNLSSSVFQKKSNAAFLNCQGSMRSQTLTYQMFFYGQYQKPGWIHGTVCPCGQPRVSVSKNSAHYGKKLARAINLICLQATLKSFWNLNPRPLSTVTGLVKMTLPSLIVISTRMKLSSGCYNDVAMLATAISHPLSFRRNRSENSHQKSNKSDRSRSRMKPSQKGIQFTRICSHSCPREC